MNTIWVYGDSFTHDLYGRGDMWPELIASKLGLQVENFSREGTAQIYSISQMQRSCHRWQPGDRVIWALTNAYRSWHRADAPSISGIHISNLQDICNHRDPTGLLATAIELHARFLVHPDLLIAEMHSRFAWLDWARQRYQVDIAVLNCFQDSRENRWIDDVVEQWRGQFFMPQGCLMELSRSEISLEDPKLEKWVFGLDPRLGHLCRSTHIRLADFLVQRWGDADCSLSDLYYQQPLITWNSMEDADFVKSQFIMEEFRWLLEQMRR